MSKLSAFSSEMEKIAMSKIPTAAFTGVGGALIGANKGFKNSLRDQWVDDDRLRRGLITQKEWADRRDYRIIKGLSYTTAGGIIGSLTPHMAGLVGSWVSDTAQRAAKPFGDQFEESSRKAVNHARKELADALDRHTKKLVQELKRESENIGRSAGKGLKTSLREGGDGIPIDHRIRMPWRKR